MGEPRTSSFECRYCISSTSASQDFIISKENDRKSASKRTSGFFLIDIALPRDIDPECNEIDDMYLFDIDDLKQVVGANFEERKKAASEGLMLVHRSSENFVNWLSSLRLNRQLKTLKTIHRGLTFSRTNKNDSKIT